jgi:hypothetical protein
VPQCAHAQLVLGAPPQCPHQWHQALPHHRFTDAEPTTAVPEPATSAPEKRVRWADSYLPTVLPTLTSVPFTRACQESSPQIAEAVQERMLEAPITISQRELLTTSPDVRAQWHTFQTTLKSADKLTTASARRHAMQGDVADTDADATTNDYSYEAVSLRFKEAREASRALWHWQEVDTTARREKDTGRDALADSFSLADTFLLDSAPQDLHVRASVNTAQVVCLHSKFPPLLQNIDADFSKMQKVLSNRILPTFKRYAIGTEPAHERREAAKV